MSLFLKIDYLFENVFVIRKYSFDSTAINLKNNFLGLVRFDEKNSVLIVTCKGPSWISIKKITIAGGAPMTAIDFRNGFMQRKIQKQIFFGVA